MTTQSSDTTASMVPSGKSSSDLGNIETNHPTADLQKGERYKNLDHLLFSSLPVDAPVHLSISYDISCSFRTCQGHRVAAAVQSSV
ncbi:hypothetical protein B0H13DRAFT_2319196 [Mycena leptocephala]|nr:hypothetical protein B0H13DRAFT_2319196 [Mycena leptocephala]